MSESLKDETCESFSKKLRERFDERAQEIYDKISVKFLVKELSLENAELNVKIQELEEVIKNGKAESRAMLDRIRSQSERIHKEQRDLQSAQERIKQLEKDVADRDLWLAGSGEEIRKKGATILEQRAENADLHGKLMAVTAERDAARAKVQELEKLKADPKPAITVSYSLINKDGTRIDGSKDSVMEVARLAKENAQLKLDVEELNKAIDRLRDTISVRERESYAHLTARKERDADLDDLRRRIANAISRPPLEVNGAACDNDELVDAVNRVMRMADKRIKELEASITQWPGCGDPVVEQVVQTLRARSAVGQAKYGVTLHASKEDKVAFLRHLLHEQCDACNYTQKLLNLEEGKAV